MIRDESPDLFNQSIAVTVRSARAKRVTDSSVEIPFMQRPTCTIKEACKASGMGRTKFYELIKGGELQMISVGRRRLVQVPSLLKFLRLDHHSSRD
jgi:excisionase family DNA binding protein